jgi:hypothetical protein
VLNEPADVRASEPRIRNILRRLGRAVGGDLSSAEPARVLRVPGTYNYKYSPPRRVTIERFALERTYSIADLEETLPAEPDRQSGRRGLVVPPEIRDGERNSMLFRTSRSCAFRKF